MILSNASEDTDCTDENVLGHIGEVDHQKDIQSLKEQFMAFIQLKNYTQLTIQNNTTNNYISLARQKLMTVILKQLISQ